MRGKPKVFLDRRRSESESEQGEFSRACWTRSGGDLPMARLKLG